MATTIIIPRTDPRIFYHGRWDVSPTTWWAASGFKLHIRNLRSLSLNLGPDTSKPSADVGVSFNYRPFVTIHASAGTNVVPLGDDDDDAETSVVRINVQRPENNHIHLESIGLNTDATLLPYGPLSLSFLFIGDSFSLGYNLPLGVNQSSSGKTRNPHGPHLV